MPDILRRIAVRRRQSLEQEKSRTTLAELQQRAGRAPAVNSFAQALQAPAAAGIHIIAELKQASPSAGIIREPFAVVPLATGLAAAGASALSVLTEVHHFSGHGDRLTEVRGSLPTMPLLRKDFLMDPWQVWESRVLGADAVLLIAALLDDTGLQCMQRAAADAGIETLIEVHNQAELERVRAVGADIIGVNARDLRTFSVDLDGVQALAACLPSAVVAVAESGVSTAGDLSALREAGYHAALVGTGLMRRRDPGGVLARWLGELASRPEMP